MARMHSRKKGKSGSTKPSKKAIPTWSRYKPKEIEMMIVKLAKEGNTGSKIGILLRDSYGVPDAKIITGKSISQMLAEHKLAPAVPEDLMALLKKTISIRKHMTQNKKDMPGKRGLQLTESKIKRLSKYYKRIGRIPEDWKYDPDKIKLFIE